MIQKLKEYCYRRFRTSFSKSGEDVMLYQLLKNTTHKFYIDIGAHDPRIHSNSYFFYLRGWNGICIDPNSSFLKEWRNWRPNDHFLNIGISSKDSSEDYFILKDSVRNTFSKDYIKEFGLEKDVIETKRVQTKPLGKVLSDLNLLDKPIGFLSIDCEGLDLEVLKSNNWINFRPELVLFETFGSLKEDFESSSVSFLEANGYEFIGKSIQYNSGHDTIGSLLFKTKEI